MHRRGMIKGEKYETHEPNERGIKRQRDEERKRTRKRERESEKGAKQCRTDLSIDHLDYGRNNCVGVKLQSRTQLVATRVRFSSFPNPPISPPPPPPFPLSPLPPVPASWHKGVSA